MTSPPVVTQSRNVTPNHVAAWVTDGVIDDTGISVTALLAAMDTGGVNVKSFGAKGDGITDDAGAFQAAFAFLTATFGGGTLYIPPGNYFLSSAVRPGSNTIIQGGGEGCTTISVGSGQLSPLNTGILIAGGNLFAPAPSPTYPINPITEGANTITTTTHSDAGNFSPGNYILIMGPVEGNFFFPVWWTTVVSANPGTGVITLAELLPFGDTTVQSCGIITPPPIKNVTVRDLSILASPNVSLQVTYAQNVLIERVSFPNVVSLANSLEIDISRDCVVRDCTSTGPSVAPGFIWEAGFGFNITFENIVAHGGVFVFDGGAYYCSAINCTSYPQSGQTGFFIGSTSQRNSLINCNVLNVSGGASGINIQGDLTSGQHQGDNLVLGCTVTGASNATNGGMNIADSNNNIVIGCNFRNLFAGIRAGSVAQNLTLLGNNFENIGGAGNYAFDSTVTLNQILIPNPWAVLSGATPNVGESNKFQVFNSVPTNVTTFIGGQVGQDMTLLFGDSNTTLIASGNINLKGSANFNPPANTVMLFTNSPPGPNNWREVSRTTP